jgi:hypothetical protein
MRRLLVLALVAVLAISIVGFAQVGTKDKPIYMLLPPSTDTTVIGPSGDKIAEYLFQETGLYVVPVVAADYAALAEAFRTADGDVFGIPTSSQYCQIYNETNGGIIPTMGAVRNGYVYYFASIYALRSKGYTSLQDLAGKTWIYNDVGSGSGYKYPKVYMQLAGVQWGNVVETGGHVNSMVALLQGQGDFCTGYGSPPLSPQCLKDQGIRWEWGTIPSSWSGITSTTPSFVTASAGPAKTCASRCSRTTPTSSRPSASSLSSARFRTTASRSFRTSRPIWSPRSPTPS